MGVISSQLTQESEEAKKLKIANQEIESLKQEIKSLQKLLLSEKASSGTFQILAIVLSVFLAVSLGIGLSRESHSANCSCDPVEKKKDDSVLLSLSNVSSEVLNVTKDSVLSSPTLTPNFSINSSAESVSAPTLPPVVLHPAVPNTAPSVLIPNSTINSSTESDLAPPVLHPPVPVTPPRPEFVSEWSDENDPWHLICDRYWVVLFYNKEHPSYKNLSSVFHSAAKNFVRLKDKDVHFGQRDCSKFPSKCEGRADPYIRIYHNGHFIDYNTNGKVVAWTNTAALNLHSLIGWIVDSITEGYFKLLPRGAHYCVNEVNEADEYRRSHHEWVVHFYDTSSPLHSNMTSRFVSAAEKLVNTGNLFFGQLDCRKHAYVCKREGRGGGSHEVQPFIRIFRWGISTGEYYYPKGEDAQLESLVPWVLTHV